MRKVTKRISAGCTLVILIVFVTFMPGLPWSAKSIHFVKKLRAKADMKVSAWQGTPPGLISLTGKIVARKGALRGAEVEVLDSASGWASLTDGRGEFVLRDVVWYPRATYTVLIKANDYQARQAKVIAPSTYPDGGVLNVGELGFDKGCQIDAAGLPGKNSVSYIESDGHNLDYYKGLFNELTAGKQTDEERLEAISRFVASKLISGESGEPGFVYKSGPPRNILENGSRYCGDLAVAMAVIAEAGNYKARVLDLIDAASQPSAHMVTEIYYGERWHLYDPVTGSPVQIKDKRVLSYKEVRLGAEFISLRAMPQHLPKIPDRANDRMADLYGSGFHHYYYLKRQAK
ncbi:MAG TPA: transglutaminase-like domain-containing protein [Blastocatellia bacterium]|nr:transglutaminase-like domain-containing protein [Blastocatellia bacterium]